MVDRTMLLLKDVLAPEPVNMLFQMGKGILQMWLKILRWGEWPELPRWAQCNHKGPYRKESQTQRGLCDGESRGQNEIVSKTGL